MGYTTDFYGEFNLNKPLTEAHKNYLEKFAEMRRMKRDAGVASKMDDPIRIAAGLPIGTEGGYFVNGAGDFGQDNDASVTNSNYPPAGQPGLWCHWVPNSEGTAIIWDGGEKFYEYVDWIEYLIENFLKPWGYVLNGEVEWIGEDSGDRGMIAIINNVVRIKVAKITYEFIDKESE
jgi:hypothetical protein